MDDEIKKPAKRARKKVKPKSTEVVVHNITKHTIHVGNDKKLEPGRCLAVPQQMADLLLELNRVEVVTGVNE